MYAAYKVGDIVKDSRFDEPYEICEVHRDHVIIQVPRNALNHYIPERRIGRQPRNVKVKSRLMDIGEKLDHDVEPKLKKLFAAYEGKVDWPTHPTVDLKTLHDELHLFVESVIERKIDQYLQRKSGPVRAICREYIASKILEKAKDDTQESHEILQKTMSFISSEICPQGIVGSDHAENGKFILELGCGSFGKVELLKASDGSLFVKRLADLNDHPLSTDSKDMYWCRHMEFMNAIFSMKASALSEFILKPTTLSMILTEHKLPIFETRMSFIAANVQDLDLDIPCALLCLFQLFKAYEHIFLVLGVWNADLLTNIGLTLGGQLKLFDSGNVETLYSKRAFPEFIGKHQTGETAISYPSYADGQSTKQFVYESFEEVAVGMENHYGCTYAQRGGIEYDKKTENPIPLLQFMDETMSKMATRGCGFLEIKHDLVNFIKDPENLKDDDFIYVDPQISENFTRQNDVRLVDTLALFTSDLDMSEDSILYFTKAQHSLRSLVESHVLEKLEKQDTKDKRVFNASVALLMTDTENMTEYQIEMAEKAKLIAGINQDVDDFDIVPFGEDQKLVHEKTKNKTYLAKGKFEDDKFIGDVLIEKVLPNVSPKTINFHANENLKTLFTRVAEKLEQQISTTISTVAKNIRAKDEDDGVYCFAEIDLEDRKSLFGYYDSGPRSGSLAKSKFIIEEKLVKQILNEKLSDSDTEDSSSEDEETN